MTNLDNHNPQPFYHRPTIRLAAALALLIPLAYLAGRYVTSLTLPSPWSVITSAATLMALGSLIGLPIGLFYGSLKSQGPSPIIHHFHPSFVKQQDKILEQIKAELQTAHDLFSLRRGDATTTTGLRYDTNFWLAAKASGQLFVMQEPKLLSTIAKAYYWLEEANRLEGLAYESVYKPMVVVDNQNSTTHLLNQARLIDGPLGASLDLATIAINGQLGTDQNLPENLQPEPVIAHTETTY
jgi:hypothetical protein